ncbi:MAG: hypothetical protein K0S51_2399 [Bacillales bacterium]|jgi:hypothetical protein|nr:hypothetical protein [Bacillales bacterium]
MNRIIEFRGIKLSHLVMYFEELNGIKTSSNLPIKFNGDKWTSEILEEKEIPLTSVISVNSVLIKFEAERIEELESIIKNYRYKTTRVGG